MKLFYKAKDKCNGLSNRIKKLIDNIIRDIEESFGPKLKPIKIKVIFKK